MCSRCCEREPSLSLSRQRPGVPCQRCVEYGGWISRLPVRRAGDLTWRAGKGGPQLLPGAKSAEGTVRPKSPPTAAQAYSTTVDLRHQGFTDIVAINTTPARRITEVNRLLKDLY